MCFLHIFAPTWLSWGRFIDLFIVDCAAVGLNAWNMENIQLEALGMLHHVTCRYYNFFRTRVTLP
jgi:hypothetical protein